MYDQGWSQVNSTYNFINRELTNPTNTKDRDAFLKQAKLNLNNLSALDLSQNQNVKAANNVFAPWANNTKALGDASLTAHWRNQEQIGEGYRLQDGGKYFSEDNVNYIRKQRAAFAKDAAESWQEYYANKRSYTPYYDYSEEWQKLMKDFKPSTFEIDRVKGLYKYTDKDASWTQAEIRKYIEANLSNKAKDQLRIEADVKYNNDPKQLGEYFKTSSQTQIKQIDEGISFIDHKLKSVTKKDEIAQLNDYKQKLNDRKTTLQKDVDAINKGDYTFIKKRGEAIAYSIYYNEVMNKFANGWSHKDITHKIDGDDVALTVYKENRADARQERALAHAERLAMLKGEIPGAAPTMNTITDVELKNQLSPESIQKQIDEVNGSSSALRQQNDAMVLNWMKNLPQNRGKALTMQDITDDNRKEFMTKGANGSPLPASHQWNINQRQLNSNQNKIGIYDAQMDDVESKVLAGYDADKKAKVQKALKEKEQLLSNLKDIKLPDGTTLTSKQLADGIRNGTIDISRNYISDFFTGGGGGGGFLPSWNSGPKTYDMVVNGKTYTLKPDYYSPTGKSNDQRNYDDIIKIRDINKSGILDDFNDDVKTYFKNHHKELTTTLNLATFTKGSYESKTLEAGLYNLFPESEYNVQHAGIGVDNVSQGSAFFYITGKGDNVASNTKVEAILKGRGYTDYEAIKVGETTLYRIGNFQSPVMQQFAQFNPEERAALQTLSLKKQSNPNAEFKTGIYNSYSNRDLMIGQDHGIYTLYIKGLDKDNPSIMEPWMQSFTTPESAIIAGQQLTATVNGVQEAWLQNYFKQNP